MELALGAKGTELRDRLLQSKDRRLPMVLLRLLFKEQTNKGKTDEQSVQNSSSEAKWEERSLEKLKEIGFTSADIGFYIRILQGSTDEERCRIVLAEDAQIPTFLFMFLIRKEAELHDATLISQLLDYCQQNYCAAEEQPQNNAVVYNDPNSRVALSRLIPNEFEDTIALFAAHCQRTDGRLSLKLADLLSEYIQHFADESHPEKGYHTQCRLFNSGLSSLRPQSDEKSVRRASPNAYFWEAQRKLLSMSATLARPLLVNGSGFRAIREVLAGLTKNHNEIRSSIRHAPTWPPYLRPGDGMDENTYLEDNWSRAVGAGMLMQEAGYCKTEHDEALDTLQGMAPDGTPTIQQRVTIENGRQLGLWEASIKATRNSQEAWDRFQHPPREGMEPGANEYTAMFEKLSLRDKPENSKALPGDKAYNFPTVGRLNLAEFERARLLPPSVDELYKQMRMNHVRPNSRCLNILVANAPSLEMANKYLYDNAKGSPVILNLITKQPEPEPLKKTPFGLFAAYINVLTQESQKAGIQIRRAIYMAEARLKNEKSRWSPHIWGIILKNLSQHHSAMRFSVTEQLKLLLVVADRIEECHGMNISTFGQFNKCIKKIMRRQLTAWWRNPSSKKNGPLATLFLQEETGDETDGATFTDESALAENNKVTAMVARVARRIKADFEKLRMKESRHHQHVETSSISVFDSTLCRLDLITGEQIHDYVLALAYLGEHDEMHRVVSLMADEWSDPELVEHLESLDEQPPEADFFEALCVYRLYAEPALGSSRLLRRAIVERGLSWSWPDDEDLAVYVDMKHDETLATLREIVEWARE